MRRFQITIFTILAGLFFVASPVFAGLSITPSVMDEKGLPREIFKYSLTIENTGDKRLTLYTFVNNISSEDGKQDFESLSGSDLADSLANWISISRATIDLDAGETKTINYEIQINLRATPGDYHAVIAFADGSTMAEAEKKPKLASLLVNIEVLDDIREEMQLKKFSAKTVSDFPIVFNYAVENIGNRALVPSGKILIYDYQGKEIASVPINEKAVFIEPGAMADLSAVWEGKNRWGRFKAFLDIKYGGAQRGSLQDTIYFWAIPNPKLILLIIILILGNILFAFLWYKNYEKYLACHLDKKRWEKREAPKQGRHRKP